MAKKPKPKSRKPAKALDPKTPPTPPGPTPLPGGAPPMAELPPAHGRRPTISLCMMVKNEEKRLPAALKSAAPWVDEIIVVDTGSTDRTVEIAQGFGAKIYHHPWEYSFSIHRNQSLGYATGDWLLILDADEEIVPESAPLLHQAVYAANVNTFFFELYNLVGDGGETFILHPRMFRNHQGFHYQGFVHNLPMFREPAAQLGVKILHHGYAEDPATMDAKHRRRAEMIRKWVGQEPANYIARAYLAHTLVSRSETVPEAVEQGLESLRQAREQNAPYNNYPRIYYPLLTGLVILKRDRETVEHGKECLDIAPAYPDPLLYITWAHYLNQRWEEVCRAARRFAELQEACAADPRSFMYFENMSVDQQNAVYFRWVGAAAHLEREEEAAEAFERMFPFRDAETFTLQAAQQALAAGAVDLARRLAGRAAQLRPEWPWPRQFMNALDQKNKVLSIKDLREQGLAALEAGQTERAREILGRVVAANPQDPQVLFSLARLARQAGRDDQAGQWLVRGLNAHPGNPEAWRMLAEAAFASGDHRQAQIYFQKLLALSPGDQAATGRLEVCTRRLTTNPPPPSVAQRPPTMLVILAGGVSPEMVRQSAPHLFLHRAWGELLPSPGWAGKDAPNWATIYTGRPPEGHGLTSQPDRQEPRGLADLAAPNVWQILASRYRVGLMSIPLGHPAPRLNGWAVSGYPAGLLEPGMVQPAELTARVLAGGYRADYVLSDLEEQTTPERLAADLRQEGVLMQVERNRIAAALALPAVDVLVIGITALERYCQVFEMASYQVFQAYQQLYGWLETLAHSLSPRCTALISQRAYQQRERVPVGGGFYFLSWLRGENGQAPAASLAPELLKAMGMDPALLAG